MKEILEVIARNLVDDRNAVSVIETEENGVVTLTLKVAPDDMGKIIGKQGRIAKSVRSVIKSVALHRNLRVNVEITSN